MHPGKVIWADLVTPDLKQAEDFYAGLFGWSFQPAAGDDKFAIATPRWPADSGHRAAFDAE